MKNAKVEFFERFQNHETWRYAPEPERTQLMKSIWRLWLNPPVPSGEGAAKLL